MKIIFLLHLSIRSKAAEGRNYFSFNPRIFNRLGILEWQSLTHKAYTLHWTGFNSHPKKDLAAEIQRLGKNPQRLDAIQNSKY